tara:strand:+ start:1720 stop:2118 length:399 start_codon:yes stop_codon:yes gene_type:complete
LKNSQDLSFEFEQNNVYISAFIYRKPEKYFYLSLFSSQSNKKKPRAKKGEANFYLCQLLELLVLSDDLELTNDFKLIAGDLTGDKSHNQRKLNKYYQGLGFKRYKDKTRDYGQPFKQSIGGFLKNCEKFEPK